MNELISQLDELNGQLTTARETAITLGVTSPAMSQVRTKLDEAVMWLEKTYEDIGADEAEDDAAITEVEGETEDETAEQ